MEPIELCETLRARLTEFKNTDLFKTALPLQYNVRAIEIAVNLCELMLVHGREIENSEYEWFKGGYYTANDFTGPWTDISKLYDELARLARKNRSAL
jgi:hypothetical protein